MANLNAITTDHLLEDVSVLIQLRKMASTQSYLDRVNQDLIEIDAELESRRPVGEFRTLFQLIEPCLKPYSSKWYDIFEIVGFEYLDSTCSCGRAQKDCTFPYCEAKND